MTELDQAEHDSGVDPDDVAREDAGAPDEGSAHEGAVSAAGEDSGPTTRCSPMRSAPRPWRPPARPCCCWPTSRWTCSTLATIVRRPADQVEAVVRGLSAQYTEDGRGFDLREVGGGWRFYTRGDCAEVVSRYVVDGQQARLTQAALETLAIIAYRQPISRGRISAVRGVNVDGVVRTLDHARSRRGGGGGARADTPRCCGPRRTSSSGSGIASLAELPPLADHVPTYAEIGDLVDLP